MQSRNHSENPLIQIFNSPAAWSIGFFLFALGMRLWALYGAMPYATGQDETFYVTMANRYASGKPFASDFFMPGWPWILSWFARFNGDLFFLRHCPVILASITVVLVYHLGRKAFSENTGKLAAFMLAIFPDHLLHSHTVQAEMAIEVFTVAATLYAFWERPWRDTPVRDTVAAFFFGAVILVKHFIGINFGGFLLSRSYSQKRFLWLTTVFLAFFLPIIFHGAYMGFTGRDPFAVINSPLKSAAEWGHAYYNAPAPTNKKKQTKRGEKLENHLKWLMNRPFHETKRSIEKNLMNLWAPGTFGIRRMLTNGYYISPGWWFVTLHLIAYPLILFLGTFGMAFGLPSPFRRYCVLSLLLLTSMSFGLYMVTRYRVSFFFMFFLFAADALTQFPQYWYTVKTGGWARRIGFAAAIAFFTWVYTDRIHWLTSYQ